MPNPYAKHNWLQGSGTTPFNATRMNEMESGIAQAAEAASLLQPGVMAAGDGALMDPFTIWQSGPNGILTIAAGSAWVPVDAGGALVRVTWPITNVVMAADPVNSKLDQVVVNSSGVVSALGGADQAGVTIDNRTGAANLPTNAVRLYDIARSTTGTTIRDRRPWTRGNSRQDVHGGTGTQLQGDATYFTHMGPYRFEVGNLGALGALDVHFTGRWQASGAGATSASYRVLVDGAIPAEVDGVSADRLSKIDGPVNGFWRIRNVAAGNRKIELQARSNSGQAFDIWNPLYLYVREDLKTHGTFL